MANMSAFIVAVFVVLATVHKVSSLGVGPCACYKLNMSVINTCQKKPPSVFSVAATNKLTLNDDCTLIPEGCISYTPFAASNITITLTKPSIDETTTIKVDGCKVMTFLPTEIQTILKAMKADLTCPVTTANKICAVPPLTNFNVALVPFYQDMLEMFSKLGPMTGMFKAKHSANQTSCIKLVGEVKRDPACPLIAITTPTIPTLPSLSSIALSSVDLTLPTDVPTVPNLFP